MNLKSLNINKIFKYILILFLLIQPVFDLKFFYNSISTLIRVIIIFILFSYYFFSSKNNKKYLMLIYPIVLCIYFVFHHINAISFNSVVPGNFNYSIIEEILYFVKMICPFLLIYSIYKSDLKKENLITIIKILVCIIGLIIIVSNIFTFSYGSYSDKTIKANFFSWFTNNDFTYQDLASKGLFEYANQISAILIIFLPFCLVSFLDNKNIYNFLILIINILSLFLLGTKVSVLGIFLVFIYTIFIYIYNYKIINKKNLPITSILSSLIILVCYALIVPNNPIFMRINETKIIETSSTSVIEENNVVTQEDIANNFSNNNKIDYNSFIAQNYKDKQIKEEFITQSYPYEYDTEFWLKILDEPLNNRVNFRFIEESMIKRVIQINNNKYDKYLGITNTRLQNIFNIERDFIVQYYALGLIGLVLIFLPYFTLIILYLYKAIKTKFKYLTVNNMLAFISILLAFSISYFTGNLLNSLSFSLYFVLLFNFLFVDTKQYNQ